MPPELEQTLALLSAHRSVLGYMLLSRGHPASLIRHSGVVFEGEQGRKYAGAIGRIVESVQAGLEEVHTGDGDAVRACAGIGTTGVADDMEIFSCRTTCDFCESGQNDTKL